jgi:AcrR family transcriptional regulator
LRAAKTIFIRDGYEGADLADIAELADRTKGAIYGHFHGKEDIFLALIEEERAKQRPKILEIFASSPNVEAAISVMREFFLSRAAEKDWALLQLEFKMFVIRHPEARKRVEGFYTKLQRDREAEYAKYIGPAGKGKNVISRTLAIHSMGPLLTALLLESEFDPELMGIEEIKKLSGRIFDALIKAP